MRRRRALAAVFRGANLRRALWVAVLVGTALNVINQPAVFLEGAAPDWAKLLLTYCVPFLVASYGAYAALASQESQ